MLIMASTSRLSKSDYKGCRKEAKVLKPAQKSATSFKNINRKLIFEIDHQHGIGKAKSKLIHRFDPLARKAFEHEKNQCVQNDTLGKTKVHKANTKGKAIVEKHLSCSRKYSNTSNKIKESSNNAFIDISEESSMVIDTDDVVAGVQHCRLQIEETNQQGVGDCHAFKTISSVEPMDIICDAVNKLFIVLDTNVLLGDLMLINDVKKVSKKTTFIVPWVVLQELDLMKSDNYKKANLKPLAIKAINYVYSRFKEHDPHFRGQRAVESSRVKFQPESNDDKILHCCLQCRGKSDGETILFSNDRNLANKALVHRIQVCTKDDIVNVVKNLMIVPESSQEINRKKQNEVIEKIHKDWNNIVELLLDEIVTTEMKNIYDDQWLSIVLIKPPWNIKEALTCIRKHWYAVFGCLLSKNAIHIAKNLLEKVKRSLRTANYKDVEELLNLSESFFSSFYKTASYNDQLKSTLSRLKQLKAQLNHSRNLRCENANESTSLNSNIDLPSTSATKTHISKNLTDASNVQSDLVIVKEAFDIVWNFINHSSGLILDCLNVNNPLSYSRPICLPSFQDANNFLKIFYPTVLKLKMLFKTIVKSDSRPADSTDIVYIDLCNLIVNFKSILGIQNDNIKIENLTPLMLHKFSHHLQTRELMERGLSQLDYFIFLLEEQICIKDDFLKYQWSAG